MCLLSIVSVMNIVRCPKVPKEGPVGSKTQNGRFTTKIALYLKKVCHKVSLCEYCQLRVVRHSLAYLSVKEVIRGGRSLLRENVAETDLTASETPTSDQYSFVAPQP